MAGKKEDLKQSIENKNWSGVVSFYNFLYDENISVSEESESSFNEEDFEEAVNQKVSRIISKVRNFLDDIADNNTTQRVDNSLQDQGSSTFNNKTKSKNQDKKIEFVTFDVPEYDNNNEYKKELKKHAKSSKHNRNMNKRDGYIPKMSDCEKCGNSFDVNREYPSGLALLGADGNQKKRKLHCNKCRTSPKG